MKNASFKPLPTKKLPKNDREQAVLLGLVELYLKSGKPIGSQTLQENGFESLSSATIRNYFSKMETQGYLKQPHTSGGRIPTAKAFRLYVDTYQTHGIIEAPQAKAIEEALSKESREVATTLHRAIETFSELTQCAVFASAPRFDQDFVQDIRLIQLDDTKLLSVVITNFGLIRTESLYVEKPVDPIFLRTTEEYFRWRMNHAEKPFFRQEAEAKMAQRLYNEIMVRHVVGYANFPAEDILRTGLSKLLVYPEFNDAAALANSLCLLEDEVQMRAVLQECCKKNQLTCWIGDELCPYVPPQSECTLIAVPYRIHQSIAGAIAFLGPMRLPYRNLFGLAQLFSEQISQSLTESVYKFKITFRQPTGSGASQIAQAEAKSPSILLEDQSR